MSSGFLKDMAGSLPALVSLALFVAALLAWAAILGGA